MIYEFKRFITESPEARLIKGKKRPCYWMLEPILWEDTDGNVHEIPCWFVHDGYSTPDGLKSGVRGTKSLLPPALHDWQIRTHECPFSLANKNLRVSNISEDGSGWTSFKLRALDIAGFPYWLKTGQDLDSLGYEGVLKRHIAETLERAQEIAMRGDD